MTLDLAMVLSITPKAQVTKEKIDDFYSIEIKSFYASETIKRGKRQSTEWGKKKKTISNHLPDKDLVSRVCRELIQFSSVQLLSHV